MPGRCPGIASGIATALLPTIGSPQSLRLTERDELFPHTLQSIVAQPAIVTEHELHLDRPQRSRGAPSDAAKLGVIGWDRPLLPLAAEQQHVAADLFGAHVDRPGDEIAGVELE